MEQKYGLSKHMLPVTVAGRRRPMLAFILDQLRPHVDQIIVGVAYRASTTEAYLHKFHPGTLTTRLPALADLRVNILHCLKLLPQNTLVFCYGDTILTKATYRAFFEAIANNPPGDATPVTLLLEPQVPNPERSTFELDAEGVVRAVRPSRNTDLVRYSTLMAAVCTEVLLRYLSREVALDDPTGDGVTYTIWPTIVRYLLMQGLATRTVVSNTHALNINNRVQLEELEARLNRKDAEVYL